MVPILPNGGRPTGRPSAFPLGLALLLAGTVSAATDQQPPEGLPAGPVFFAPWFQTEVLADDNIFRRTETQQQVPVAGLADSDVATTLRAGVTALVPIRMSNLEIGYEGSTFFYKDSNFSDTDSHTGNMNFELNFSSHDTLRIEETYTDGHTELQRALFDTLDDGASSFREIIRQGIPFSSNVWAVEWMRQVTGRPGWRTRVERSYLRYDSDVVENIPWNDSDGWEVSYEYDQPIYHRGEFTAMYTGRREEEFVPGPASSSGIPEGVPLRRQDYDALEIGFRGLIGSRQPLFARLGYARLAFRDVQRADREPSNYHGLVGNVTWRLPVGGLSNMVVNVNRNPLASIYNTYYIINEVRIHFDRRFREVSRWGLNLLASSNRYGDFISTEAANGTPTQTCTVPGPVPGSDDVSLIRHDRNQKVEGYWEWFVQPRVALRMSAARNQRDSNCQQSGFRSSAVGMTFKIGWF